MASPNQPSQQYDAGNIQVLKGLEAVRKRPGMYVGSTSSRGLHHLVYEVVDNSIDEALAGYCDRVQVTIHADDSITVEDNGRGIPVDLHPTEKIPGVELAMTVLHAGGKFDKDSYKVSGGLHGVGVSVVNALSESLKVWVKRDGEGVLHGLRARSDDHQAQGASARLGARAGTKIWFKPDPQIFTELTFDYATIASRLRELSFLNKGVSITLTDEREEPAKTETFLREGRPQGDGAVPQLQDEAAAPGDPVPRDGEGRHRSSSSPSSTTTATTRTCSRSSTTSTRTKAARTSPASRPRSRARSTTTPPRGTSSRRRTSSLSGDDVREGLTAVLAVKIREPQFEGQTKTKLGNSEAECGREDRGERLARRLPRRASARRRTSSSRRRCRRRAPARRRARRAT